MQRITVHSAEDINNMQRQTYAKVSAHLASAWLRSLHTHHKRLPAPRTQIRLRGGFTLENVKHSARAAASYEVNRF